MTGLEIAAGALAATTIGTTAYSLSQGKKGGSPFNLHKPPKSLRDPIERLQDVETSDTLTKKKIDAARSGSSQFIWLPTVSAPSG